MKNFRIFFLLLLGVAIGSETNAHVGSPGVVVQKRVGKYQVLVSVVPPDVVPGTANVTVFVEQGRISGVKARPVYFRSGDEGAPSPDALSPGIGPNGDVSANRFEGIVWLMSSGSSSIEVQLEGPDGNETVVVPVVSVATAQRSMPAGTGAALAVLALLLVVILITTIGASLADATLKPGVSPPANLRRKRLVGMGIAAVLVALMLTGGRTWWTSWADEYRNENLYRALPIRATAEGSGLRIRVDTVDWKRNSRPLSLLVPDHGKLMHAFLIRTPGLDAFAHLHPERRDTLTYHSALPNLPAGNYLLYADVVYRSGFAETLTDTVEVRAPALATKATDSDDSYTVTNAIAEAKTPPPTGLKDIAICGKPGVRTGLADGSGMVWEEKSDRALEAGKLYTLRFAVTDPAGKPAALEPYLGMGGHAAILASDGSVYIHLHPVGTYSMAAEDALEKRFAETSRIASNPDPRRYRDSIDTYLSSLKALPETERNTRLMAGMPGMSHAMNGMVHANVVEFPYAFPKAGRYRVWVQVKRAGKVLTGVFDAEVKESIL